MWACPGPSWDIHTHRHRCLSSRPWTGDRPGEGLTPGHQESGQAWDQHPPLSGLDMPGQREAGHLSHNPESSSQDLLWCSVVSQQDTSFQPVSGPRGTGPCHLVQPLPVTVSLLAPSLITCSCPHSPVGSAYCPHLGEETGPAAGGLQPEATHPGACLLTATVAGCLSCCCLSKTGLGKCPEL